MRTLYQLRAHGARKFFGGSGQVYSKRVYSSRTAAEAAIPEFKKLCCDSGDKIQALTDLDAKTVAVNVVELDFEDVERKDKQPMPIEERCEVEESLPPMAKRDESCCTAEHGEWACTRLANHDGNHIACTTDGNGNVEEICCVWSDPTLPVPQCECASLRSEVAHLKEQIAALRDEVETLRG